MNVSPSVVVNFSINRYSPFFSQSSRSSHSLCSLMAVSSSQCSYFKGSSPRPLVPPSPAPEIVRQHCLLQKSVPGFKPESSLYLFPCSPSCRGGSCFCSYYHCIISVFLFCLFISCSEFSLIQWYVPQQIQSRLGQLNEE